MDGSLTGLHTLKQTQAWCALAFWNSDILLQLCLVPFVTNVFSPLQAATLPPPCGSSVSVADGSGTTLRTAAGGCQVSFYGQNEHKANVSSPKCH